jgi:hypothetical protein
MNGYSPGLLGALKSSLKLLPVATSGVENRTSEITGTKILA